MAAAPSRRELFRNGALAWFAGALPTRAQPAAIDTGASKVEALREAQLYAAMTEPRVETWTLQNLSQLDRIAQWGRRNPEAAAPCAADLRLLREAGADPAAIRGVILPVRYAEAHSRVLARIRAGEDHDAEGKPSIYAREFAADFARLETQLAKASGRGVHEIAHALQMVLHPRGVIEGWIEATAKPTMVWPDDLSIYDDEFVRHTLEGLDVIAPSYASLIRSFQMHREDELYKLIGSRFGIFSEVSRYVRVPWPTIVGCFRHGRLEQELQDYGGRWANVYARLIRLHDVTQLLGESITRTSVTNVIDRLTRELARAMRDMRTNALTDLVAIRAHHEHESAHANVATAMESYDVVAWGRTLATVLGQAGVDPARFARAAGLAVASFCEDNLLIEDTTAEPLAQITRIETAPVIDLESVPMPDAHVVIEQRSKER